MDGADLSIMSGGMCLSGQMVLFKTPFSTLNCEVNITTTQKALRDEIEAKAAGHRTVFSVGKENKFAVRLKDVAGRFIGYSPKQICRMAFLFAILNDINDPWGKEKVCAGKDCFSSFLNYLTNSAPHQLKIPSKSHKSSGPPSVFLSTPDLNDRQLSTDTRIKTEAETN